MKVVHTDKAINMAKALQTFDNYAQVNSHENLAMLLQADDPVAEVTNMKNQVMESFDGLMKAAMDLKTDAAQVDDMQNAQKQLSDERAAFEKEKSDFAMLKHQSEMAGEAQAASDQGPAMQPNPATNPPSQREAKTVAQNEEKAKK